MYFERVCVYMYVSDMSLYGINLQKSKKFSVFLSFFLIKTDWVRGCKKKT